MKDEESADGYRPRFLFLIAHAMPPMMSRGSPQ
jgi:hypothetical protein